MSVRASRVVTIIFLAVLSTGLLLPSAVATYQDVLPEVDPISARLSAALGIPHAEFNITSDEDFSAQGWPGNGTDVAPYRIEDLEIGGYGCGVLVANTTKHFVIERCDISSPSGVVFWNVSHGSVVNCTFTSWSEAIAATQVLDCLFQNNRISNSVFGVSLHDARRTALLGNTMWEVRVGVAATYTAECDIGHNNITDFSQSAFQLSAADSASRIHDNLIESGDGNAVHGFEMWGGSGWYIEENEISNCVYGALLYGFSDSVLTGNGLYASGVGMMFSSCDNITASSNHVKGDLAGIVAATSRELEVTSNTILKAELCGLLLSGCTRCVIEGNDMTDAGLWIGGSAPSHWRHAITGNTVATREIGYFKDLEGGTIGGEEYAQVLLVNCTSVVVEDGEFSDCAYGVFIGWSNSCIIRNCSLHNNRVGGMSLIYTINCAVTGNSIHHNCGEYIQYGALTLRWADHTDICENVIRANNGSGIGFEYGTMSDHTLVYNNVITNNTGYGILITAGSEHNSIYGNVIGWNGLNNSLDYASDTQWDDGVGLGNWWSDYNGTGWYVPDGGRGNVDHYPVNVTRWNTQLPISNQQDGWPWIVMPAVVVAMVSAALVAAVIARRRRGEHE